MKQTVPNRQRDLFELEPPQAALPPDRRAKLLPLLQALLMETLRVDASGVQGGNHEQDRA